MNNSDVTLLFDHLYWVRDRILEAADAPRVPFTDPAPPTIRDLRATLVHELDVEWSWRERLSAEDRTAFPPGDVELAPEDFTALADLRARWVLDEAEMRRWIAGLSDAELERPCRVEAQGSHPFWFHLQHLYSHGLQQFADAAVLLTRAGRSPGELDYLDYVRDRQVGG
jgi:uncharacterized damage-inducible protein DinB